MKPFRLTVSALVAVIVLLLSVGNIASAQGYGVGSRGADNQRSKSEAAKNKSRSSGKVENAFPNSTRKEPEAKSSAKLGKKLQDGSKAFSDENYEKAEKLFNEVLAAPKALPYEKAFANLMLASIAFERDDDPMQSVAFNIKAIELNALPNDQHFAAMQLVSQLYLQEDQFEQAVTWADRWLTETGEKRDTLLVVKAQAYYQLEKYDLAAENIKVALEVSAKPSDSWNALLIACYTESGNIAEAIRVGESILAKNPNEKNVIKQLSNLYIEQDQNDKALALMDKAYTSGLLSSEQELRQLAQLYSFAERPAQGAKIIMEGLTKGVLPENLATYALLGEVYAQGDDSLKTAEAYGKAAQYATDGEMKFQQAYWLYDADKAAEAKAAALEALKKTPFKHEGECWLILGNSELSLDNKAGAIAAFEKAAKFPGTKKSAESWLKNARRM